MKCIVRIDMPLSWRSISSWRSASRTVGVKISGRERWLIEFGITYDACRVLRLERSHQLSVTQRRWGKNTSTVYRTSTTGLMFDMVGLLSYTRISRKHVCLEDTHSLVIAALFSRLCSLNEQPWLSHDSFDR